MEFIKIASLVVLPTLFPLCFCYLYSRYKKNGPIWRKLVAIQPDKGLFEQPIFWLSICIPVFYFLAFGAVVWVDYTPEASAGGLSTFLQISVFPLTLLSLAVPFSVVVASFHSTEQTAVQIRLTTHKNNLESYYSHRNELFNYFDRLGPLEYLETFTAKFSIHPRVHKYFFIGSPEKGVPELNDVLFDEIESRIDSARRWLHWVLKGDIATSNLAMDQMYLIELCGDLYHLINIFNIRTDVSPVLQRSMTVPIQIDGQARTMKTIGSTRTDVVAVYRYARAYFRNLCDFAGRRTNEGDIDQYLYFEIYGEYLHLPNDNIQTIVFELLPDWYHNPRTLNP